MFFPPNPQINFSSIQYPTQHPWKSSAFKNSNNIHFKNFSKMASRKTPNAWDDDDWEAQADQALQEVVEGPGVQEPTTKAERLAKHREAQRKIWEAA